MDTQGFCGACGSDFGGVNVELIRAARRRLTGVVDAEALEREDAKKQVWANECRLVISDESNGLYKTGEMGICYPKDDREVQVRISSWDRSAKHPEFSQLEGVPVRVTIERVPGGNV
jgi:hypothetical protein